MRLNGIFPPVGTVVGLTQDGPALRLVVVSEVDERGCVLRHATKSDVSLDVTRYREPRSLAEHEGLDLVSTPYGRASVFGPHTPTHMARVEIEMPDVRTLSRHMRKELRSLRRATDGQRPIRFKTIKGKAHT